MSVVLLLIVCPLTWLAGFYGWRLFPKFPRGSLLVAAYDEGDEFLVRYQHRRVGGLHRCAYVSELDGSLCRIWLPGRSLTISGSEIRPMTWADA